MRQYSGEGIRVLLLDDSLTGWAGHNAGYDFSIQDELARRGIGSVVYANVKANNLLAARPVGLKPIFQHYADLTHHEYAHLRLPSGVAGLFNLLIGNWHHLKDLYIGVTSDTHSGDIVINTMQSPVTSFANAIWLLLERIRGRRLVFLSVVHNLPTKFFHAEWQAYLYLGRGHKIMLGAHTEEIAGLCQAMTGARVQLFPLPFANRGASRAESEDISSIKSTGQLTVTYLGMASYPKGYDLVIESLFLLGDLITENRVNFVIQCNSQQYDDQSHSWKQALLEYCRGNPLVTMIDGPLSGDEYVRQFRNSDLILVPNRKEYFSQALSGVFAEAVSMGKPVVVAEGTLMANELRKGLGSGVVFRSGDAGAMVAAIRVAVTNNALLAVIANAVAEKHRIHHSPERYVDTLLDLNMKVTG